MHARGILIGEGPGHEEVAMRRPFVGMTGRKLDLELEGVALHRRDLTILNATACYPTDKSVTNMRQAVRCCAPAFNAQLAKAPQTAPILAMGAYAAEALGMRLKIGVARGFIRSYKWHPVVLTWHPTYAFFRAPGEHGAFSVDLARFARLIDGMVPSVPKVNTAPKPADLWTLGPIIGCDIETAPATMDAPHTGKDPMRARLKTIAFANEHRAIATIWPPKNPLMRGAIKQILAADKVTKVFHNGRYFDVPVLEGHGLPVHNIEDTRDLRRALSSTSKVSLRYLASLYLDFPPWKETDDEDAEKMYETEDIESLLQYNGLDALVTARIWAKMWREANEQDHEDHAARTQQGSQERTGGADGGAGSKDALAC